MPHYHQLTLEQRYTIESLLQAKKRKAQIADIINVSYTTLFREIKRNSINGVYSHKKANQLTLQRRIKAKKPTVITELIKPQILAKLKQRWSPEQIAGRAKLKNEYNISHQSIYNLIAADKKNGGTLYKYLRRKRKYRKHKTKESHIRARVMIDQRPEVVEKRERLGDWEIDCIISTKGDSTVIVTAVDRVSRFICASLLDNRDSFKLARRVCRLLKGKEVKTITSDNGTEFASHQYVARTLECEYYFAHPYHSWERGSSENANAHIRQYLPSGKPLKGKWRTLSKALKAINNRPRKCLGYLTAHEYMEKHQKRAP